PRRVIAEAVRVGSETTVEKIRIGLGVLSPDAVKYARDEFPCCSRTASTQPQECERCRGRVHVAGTVAEFEAARRSVPPQIVCHVLRTHAEVSRAAIVGGERNLRTRRCHGGKRQPLERRTEAGFERTRRSH